VLKGKIVPIYFMSDEFDKLFQQCNASDCRSFSEFIRNILANKPIIVRERNETIDNYLEIAIDLKTELHNIVHSEDHSLLPQKIEEIRALMYKIYYQCTEK